MALVVAGVAGCASADEDREPERRVFGVQGARLVVDSRDSALEVVASERVPEGEVRVTRWFKGSVAVGGEPEVSWRMEGDRLTLRMKCSGVFADCAVKHLVEVPRGLAVEVEEGDGSVRARGFRDALSVRTGDGAVHVTDSTGPLRLRSGDGAVRAEVDATEVRAQTGDGALKIEVGVVPRLVEARSGDGSVTVEVPDGAYRVSADAGDGGVDVDVPRDSSSAHVLRAHAGDGKVTVRTAN
ncbi:DUF4097 family beta strand repeat-containing protein [Streptomyces sp. GXMU-J15]|uniref:DUF4097 family beta strand repeat-containing protein n=1 Tax=Streptomyces fuscus TaxID=3048495 RepID=A0ABT7J3H5_9ACTN|nr:DUF4097 family beta strand repeat-containing protein [Streptomyces fuscus]MDL2079405.1 DUF4097 family beta strand repeat-containing protein [Streptomyces fuscus]